jgi:hypothetical protein
MRSVSPPHLHPLFIATASKRCSWQTYCRPPFHPSLEWAPLQKGKSMIKCMILLIVLVNLGCHSRESKNLSSVKADGTDACSAPIDRLNVDCLIQVMQRLPDNEIIRNLRLLSQQNPILKKALFNIANNQVPKWRLSQIRQELAHVESQGRNRGRNPSGDDLFEDEVIQNYVEFVKSISNESSSGKRELSSKDSSIGQPLVTLKGSKTGINDSRSGYFVSGHVAVYQASDLKILGIDTTNGAEIFSYDTGGKVAKALAPIGEGKFLSAHQGVVLLWSLDPKVGSQKPLAQWVHPSFSDEANSVELIVMNPDVFVTTSRGSACVFKISSSEPTQVLQRAEIRYRLKKMSAEELFIEPEGKEVAADMWVPEFLNVKSGRLVKSAALQIEGAKNMKFFAVSDSKIILYNREVMRNHNVFVYDKNKSTLSKLSNNYYDLRFGSELVYLGTSSCSGDVYDVRTGELIQSVEEKFLPLDKISHDHFISKLYGATTHIYSRRKKLARIGSFEDLGGVKYPTSLYIKSVSDQGEIILGNNSREIIIVNLWVNVAKKLAKFDGNHAS